MRSEFRPELGAAWLSLLSTVSGRRREQQQDVLTDPEQLGRFLAAFGLEPRRRPDADDLRAAVELRENLYPVARAVVDGTPVQRAAVSALQHHLGGEPPRLRIDGGRLELSRPVDTDAALARLARQAVDDLAGPNPARLRACGDSTCGSIFVDDTGRRRWCNDALCGSKARVRAHRARRGSRPTAAPAD